MIRMLEKHAQHNMDSEIENWTMLVLRSKDCMLRPRERE